MGIIGTIYGWFESFYGVDLADYLLGFNCNTQMYDNQNLLNIIGIISILMSFVVMIIYYYVIKSASFNRWWSWLIMLLTVFFIALSIGWGWVYTDYLNGSIQSCLMDNITENYFFGFGIANALVASLFFFLFSCIGKWRSVHCKYSPF